MYIFSRRHAPSGMGMGYGWVKNFILLP
jgi:hypothetical protein